MKSLSWNHWKGSSYSITRHSRGFYYVRRTQSELKRLRSEVSDLQRHQSQLKQGALNRKNEIESLKEENASLKHKISVYEIRSSLNYCQNGYKRVNGTCIDIDECYGDHNCRYGGAICENKQGSYDCVCPSGFEKINGNCIDINECITGSHDCDPNAYCTNSSGSFECTCRSGYSGYGTCCDEDPVGLFGSCTLKLIRSAVLLLSFFHAIWLVQILIIEIQNW